MFRLYLCKASIQFNPAGTLQREGIIDMRSRIVATAALAPGLHVGGSIGAARVK